MTTKINGTNTAASPAITGADTDTGLSFGSDTVNINTGGSTRATVDNSKLQTFGDAQFEGNDGTDNQLKWDKSDDSLYFRDNVKAQFGTGGDFQLFHDGSNNQIKSVGSGQRVTMQSTSGTVHLAGTAIRIKDEADSETMATFTSDGSVDLYYDGAKEFETDATGIRVDMQTWGSDPSSSNWGAALASPNSGGLVIAAPATSGSDCSLFINPNGIVGRIQTSGSSTSFNTSSDYRLKENQVAISDGLTRLKQLKPYRFNFKADASKTVDGFFAHEVTNAVPEAVTGEKDAVELEDNDKKGIKKGDIIPQGIDQSKLVPLLTAALQEAITKIETLETKVAALEAA